ncbi:hypothetical protein D3C80_1909020 [compost metagenome]
MRHTIGELAAFAAGHRHTTLLKSDGTVTAVGDNKYVQCDVSGWRDIVTVAAGNVHMATNTGNAHTIGLKSDDTVVAVGRNNEGQCNVSACAASSCPEISFQ